MTAEQEVWLFQTVRDHAKTLATQAECVNIASAGVIVCLDIFIEMGRTTRQDFIARLKARMAESTPKKPDAEPARGRRVELLQELTDG
jgi:hypothetical protein